MWYTWEKVKDEWNKEKKRHPKIYTNSFHVYVGGKYLLR